MKIQAGLKNESTTKRFEMKRLLRYKFIFLGIAIGGAAGYLYFHFVGCASGSCAITSSPVNSTLYGAAMGGLLFNLFHIKDNSTTE
jgi:phage shock protein E